VARAQDFLKMKGPSLLKILIIVISTSIVLVGFFVASQYYTSGPDFPSASKREFLPDQGFRTGDVALSVDKADYYHGEIISEPVVFTIANNTVNSIFFYMGCAVQSPYVFRGMSQDRIIAPSPQPVCTAVPSPAEVSPGQSKSFYRHQISPAGGFLENGVYRLGIEYSFEKVTRWNLGDMEMIYSQTFTIKEAIWDKTKQVEICRLYGTGLQAITGGYYSEENCISQLNKL